MNLSALSQSKLEVAFLEREIMVTGCKREVYKRTEWIFDIHNSNMGINHLERNK